MIFRSYIELLWGTPVHGKRERERDIYIYVDMYIYIYNVGILMINLINLGMDWDIVFSHKPNSGSRQRS